MYSLWSKLHTAYTQHKHEQRERTWKYRLRAAVHSQMLLKNHAGAQYLNTAAWLVLVRGKCSLEKTEHLCLTSQTFSQQG
mmetsp:Transcript_10464/g.28625  ORF Transcript_10464/g.28625 Transcript_10464/m.28625 type:complete len:80 (-) Transcript_10464:1175-1414(-)